MAEIDSTYTFVALPPEERARIAVQKLEEMERAFFTAQVELSIRKAELPTDATAEEKAALTDEAKRVIAAHKKRLKAATTIFNEVKITPPAPAPDTPTPPA